MTVDNWVIALSVHSTPLYFHFIYLHIFWTFYSVQVGLDRSENPLLCVTFYGRGTCWESETVQQQTEGTHLASSASSDHTPPHHHPPKNKNKKQCYCFLLLQHESQFQSPVPPECFTSSPPRCFHRAVFEAAPWISNLLGPCSRRAAWLIHQLLHPRSPCLLLASSVG